MFFKGFSIFSSGGHFVQWSRIILATNVDGHLKDIFVKLFCNPTIGLGGDAIKMIFSILSSGIHIVQWSVTILAILVKVHPRNISGKLFFKSVHWSRKRCHL